MVAVFARNGRDYNDIRFLPAKNFKRITREDDVYGIVFEAVILIPGFWENKDVKEAYNILFERQHELFTIKK
jgi:hypothetical protein